MYSGRDRKRKENKREGRIRRNEWKRSGSMRDGGGEEGGDRKLPPLHYGETCSNTMANGVVYDTTIYGRNSGVK